MFSTTVEPTENAGKMKIFTYKLGKGINSREALIYAVHKDNMEVRVVKK